NIVTILIVDGFQPQLHIEFEFDPVTIFPGAFQRQKLAWLNGVAHASTVDRKRCLGTSPGGNSQIHRERFWASEGKVELSGAEPWIFGPLRERAGGIVLRPRNPRGHKKIHIHAVVTLVIRTDAVIGSQLWERSRTAGPLVAV